MIAACMGVSLVAACLLVCGIRLEMTCSAFVVGKVLSHWDRFIERVDELIETARSSALIIAFKLACTHTSQIIVLLAIDFFLYRNNIML